jgi:hypothetical protein
LNLPPAARADSEKAMTKTMVIRSLFIAAS